MKRERNPLMLLFLAGSILLGLSSCKKDDTDTTSNVSEEEIAEAISQSVTTESGGLVVQTTVTAGAINDANTARWTAECGILHEDEITGSSAAGAVVSYSFAYSRNWLLSCNSSTPQQFEFNYSGKATYDAPRMASDDSATAKILVTGLGTDSSYYVFNQQYTRNGSQASKIGRKRSFTSLIDIRSTNIKVDKTTLLIVSGTASITVSGKGADGYSFSYSGTLTFSGNKTATLVLGNGNTYTLTW